MKTHEFATDTKDGRKSPEVIKQNARTCISQPATESCYCCPLHGECHGLVEYVIKDLLDLVLMYEPRLAQVERERDAAVKAVEWYPCFTCKNISSAHCKDCLRNRSLVLDRFARYLPDNYEWRGVCEENTKGE